LFEFKRNIEICDSLNKKLKPSKRKEGRHIYHAYQRAETIRKNKVKADSTKIGNTTIYSNPDFFIHEFLKAVLKDSGDL
jgi:hypothetical protein